MSMKGCRLWNALSHLGTRNFPGPTGEAANRANARGFVEKVLFLCKMQGRHHSCRNPGFSTKKILVSAVRRISALHGHERMPSLECPVASGHEELPWTHGRIRKSRECQILGQKSAISMQSARQTPLPPKPRFFDEKNARFRRAADKCSTCP